MLCGSRRILGVVPEPHAVRRLLAALGRAVDRLWVAALTYVPPGGGFLSLAVVLDGLEPAGDRRGDGHPSAA